MTRYGYSVIFWHKQRPAIRAGIAPLADFRMAQELLDRLRRDDPTGRYVYALEPVEMPERNS